MENINRTVVIENRPNLSEWLAEFRCGIMAPKIDDRARDIMATWTQGGRPVDWKEVVEKIVARSEASAYL